MQRVTRVWSGSKLFDIQRVFRTNFVKIGQNLNFSRQHFLQTTDILTVFCTNFVKIGQNVKLSRQHFQQTMKITQHARGLSLANFKSHCVKSLENSLFIPAFRQYRQHIVTLVQEPCKCICYLCITYALTEFLRQGDNIAPLVPEGAIWLFQVFE